MLNECINFLLGGLLESGPLFSDPLPSSNANAFQPITSGHPTTSSVTFGVPTIASMTQKNSKAAKSTAAAITSRPAELTAAYVKSTQTKLEEADSESSMPCSLPDDVANRYARYAMIICFPSMTYFTVLM